MVERTWDDARVLRNALHGVGLAGAGLPIREDSTIETAQATIHHARSAAIVYILVACRMLVDCIESKRVLIGPIHVDAARFAVDVPGVSGSFAPRTSLFACFLKCKQRPNSNSHEHVLVCGATRLRRTKDEV